MQPTHRQESIGMPRGSTLRIDDGAGTTVLVREGELWITEEGSREDRVLQSGQWYRLERNGAAVAQAFRRSVVALTRPA